MRLFSQCSLFSVTVIQHLFVINREGVLVSFEADLGMRRRQPNVTEKQMNTITKPNPCLKANRENQSHGGKKTESRFALDTVGLRPIWDA
jgi:hypothetical protein